MVALLLYGYSRGLYSSRQLARACEERVDVMAVTGLNRPDFRTVAGFRKRHLAALSDLFVQVLQLCRAAGLVGFAHGAVDGTKLKANASRHKAMSYGRIGERTSARRRGRGVAGAGHPGRCGRGPGARHGSAWRRDAGLAKRNASVRDGRQAAAA